MPRNVNTHGRRRNRIVRRRRQNFLRLLALAGASLVLAVLPHLHWLVWVHLGADAGLALYVWRLLVFKQRERQAAEVVTELPTEDAYAYTEDADALASEAESPRQVIAT